MYPLLCRTVAVAVAAVLSAGVTACSGDNPAGATAAASGAFMDGGVTFGSGGRAGTSGTDNTRMAADSGSTARGGVTFGSGG